MRFNCPFCGEELDYTETHGSLGESNYECEDCNKKFAVVVTDKESE